MEKDTIDLRSLLDLLLRRLWIILGSAVLMGAAFFAFAKFVMPLKYESYTSMYVKNNTNTKEQQTDININDLNASKSLVSTYIAVLDSDTVMESVGNALQVKFDKATLEESFTFDEKGKINIASVRKCFTMSSVDDTEVMNITAVTTDPEVSAHMCNVIADIAPEFLVRVVGAGSVEVIDAAKINEKAVSPNFRSMAIRGVLVGLVLSALIVVLVDMFDNTVKESDKLVRRFNKATIGEVMEIEGVSAGNKKVKKSTDEERLLLTDTKRVPFNVVESYKSIRTNIIFSLGTTGKNTIAVSSCNPSEGKSTSAANVAIAFAQTGCSVLLIDADMRKPVQHKIFKTSNKVGLSTVIIGLSSVEESVKKDVVKNLDLLPSGKMPPNPSELLSSQQFGDMLEKVSRMYDYVIIDTPPINIVSDAVVISGLVGGAMIVLKYGSTTYDDVGEAMKQLNLAGVNVLGFMLNEVHRSHTGTYYSYKYKYKYSDYGYSYGGSSEEEDN